MKMCLPFKKDFAKLGHITFLTKSLTFYSLTCPRLLIFFMETWAYD